MAPSKPYEGVSAAADLSKGDIFHGKLQLEYSVGKKHKTYTSSGKSITMGNRNVQLSLTKLLKVVLPVIKLRCQTLKSREIMQRSNLQEMDMLFSWILVLLVEHGYSHALCLCAGRC